jgi:DNA segregation ATPase FtsK/SpoIIIE-like protein
MIGDTQISCADLALELGLKQPFSDKEVVPGQTRAAELLKILEGTSEETLTEAERSVYVARAREALAAIAERRGPGDAAFSDQPGDGGGGTSPSRWPLPPFSILIAPEAVKTDARNEVNSKGRVLQETLSGFGVAAQVLEEYTSVGPKVVRYGVLPTGKGERKTKVEQITRLKKDIQRVLQAKSIRMLDPVPGTPYVGIEVENPSPTIVRLREILESPEYQLACAKSRSRLVIVLGRDVAGKVRFFDLAKAPHVLIAGTTGGGKSVCVDTILCSLLMRTTPEDVRLVLVDPKKVGLSFYNEIPHLLGPVITDVTTVAPMLRTMKQRMQDRYELFQQLKVRDLEEYRQLRAKRRHAGDSSLSPIPAYIILIDEMANVMLAEKDEVEPLLCDITAMGRAAGIHVILATQRPIVEVITGTIKNNIPTRIGFMVPQAVDSRVILDQGGAEILLGQGDMLYLSEGTPAAERMQCALTETEEVERITRYWQKAKPLREGEVEPIDATHVGQLPLDDWVTSDVGEEASGEGQGDQLATLIEAFLNGTAQIGIKLSDLENEQLYRFVNPWTRRQTLISNQDLMFTFGLGQPRAAKLMAWLQRDGIVGPDRGAGRKREVLGHQEAQPVETSV